MTESSHGHFRARGEVDPIGAPDGASALTADCLLSGQDAAHGIRIGLLHTVRREVLDAAGNRVESLLLDGRRHDAGLEAVERELSVPALPNRAATIVVAAERRAELREAGRTAGWTVWRWEALHATAEAWVEQIGPTLRKVHVEVANRLEWVGDEAEHDLPRSFYVSELQLTAPRPAGSRDLTVA